MPVTPPMVRNLVPMLHVASVPRAAAFYARLGFAIAHTHHEPDHGDAPVWAWLHSPGGADLMLALADSPTRRSIPQPRARCSTSIATTSTRCTRRCMPPEWPWAR